MSKVIQISAAVAAALQGPAPTAPARTQLAVHGAPVRYSADLVPAGLPPSVETAALLLTSTDAKPARQLLTNELGRDLCEPLALVPFLLGHRNTLLAGADLFAMGMAVAEMVQRDFPALTIPEIGLALRRGCSGEWKKPDELLLPSLPVIRSWLKNYCEGSRARAVQVLQLATARQQQLSLPRPNPAAGYPAQVAALVQAARAAGRRPALVPAGQRPGPGHYRLPADPDPGGVLFAWLRRIGALHPRYGGQFRIMVKEGLLITRELPRTTAHRTFAAYLRTGGLPASHTLAGHWRTNCQKRQLRQWLTYHAAAGTDLLTWLQQLATTPAD